MEIIRSLINPWFIVKNAYDFQQKKVHRTLAGNRCLQFCNVSPGSSVSIDLGLAPCLGEINKIKTCFIEAVRANNG